MKLFFLFLPLVFQERKSRFGHLISLSDLKLLLYWVLYWVTVLVIRKNTSYVIKWIVRSFTIFLHYLSKLNLPLIDGRLWLEKCFRFPTYHIMIKEFFTHIMKVFLLEKDGVWEILQNTKNFDQKWSWRDLNIYTYIYLFIAGEIDSYSFK